MKPATERLIAHLNDPAAVHVRHTLPIDLRDNGFEECVIRNPFVTTNGVKLSIQQSSTHYCNKAANTFELGFVEHSPLLAPYGEDGDSIYAHVPFDVVVAYIEERENQI